MNNVPIMPRDEINEPRMLIFQQLFSVYSLKLSLACIFAKGFEVHLTPFLLIPELWQGIISIGIGVSFYCHAMITSGIKTDDAFHAGMYIIIILSLTIQN